ncbi:serine protease hepsin-like isoform X2 [Littorina saxatilis]|uniref:serine protease hepsin-like isoform X2 n=1 Tax=Littorina saxatilis TaxID=31220 RepID=UPI0038B54B01
MWFPALFLGFIFIEMGVNANKIDAEGCGQRPLAPSARVVPRIVGGTESTPYSWPFMCSIEDTLWNAQICAGSLVKNRRGDYFVLTTAHCVSHANGDVARFKVWCSLHNIEGSDPLAQTLQLDSLHVHPGFDVDYNDDVALFQLSVAPNETSSLQPVCLPTVPHAAFEMATVLGWGHTSEGGTRSSVLREGRKPVIADAQCEHVYSTVFKPASMLCAGYLGIGGVDACTVW